MHSRWHWVMLGFLLSVTLLHAWPHAEWGWQLGSGRDSSAQTGTRGPWSLDRESGDISDRRDDADRVVTFGRNVLL